MTKFTTPEELFRPVSISGLKADDYRRITTGRLAETELAFLDEVFKASSAILTAVFNCVRPSWCACALAGKASRVSPVDRQGSPPRVCPRGRGRTHLKTAVITCSG
jgi:hypothetical protein